ncbi:hypothetical protein CAPTEDRAFT_182740 [Capitella teleta]|uniref:Fe2OG dioxygenase domain-containing protein n=1 Tax=Capitella teleta TaxID=283909 RepID=R7UNN4_CAPTE|nr:hypothetical protein CAPTEDRAFT_182740 [Capitella teleta]|eukprot:ELU05537.1 hypothetical protein CAPTEDRAFT_182740 [Capitella teleta]
MIGCLFSRASVPAPGISYRRIVARLSLVFIFLIAAKFFGSEETDKAKSVTFAKSSESLRQKSHEVQCPLDYHTERVTFPKCLTGRCGRYVMDEVVRQDEAQHLLRIAQSGLKHGGSSGGASILDLHSGALSFETKFINIYKIADVFTQEDFDVYKRVKNKIHSAIATSFNMQPEALYLTKPTFFSRMNSREAKTVHDEYWHVHIDKETYGSFHYTSLLYLSNYGSDFSGGRFVFVDRAANVTVEPRMGRVSFFTSGSEHPHFVERVESGTRYAITISFTCDPNKAISDPILPSEGQS